MGATRIQYPRRIIAAPPLESDDAMPLNETDKAWIRQEIQVAHKRMGLSKLTGFIKDWSGTSAAVAILILFFTQWTAYVEFRTTTNETIKNINSQLKDIDGKLALQQVTAQASLSSRDFKASLPLLSSALGTVQRQKLTISNDVLSDVISVRLDVEQIQLVSEVGLVGSVEIGLKGA